MIITRKTLEKQKRLFQKMSPDTLDAYCEQHPTYSLAIGVRNQRTKEAIDIMANCAQELSVRERQILGVYIQETFRHGDVKVKPTIINAIYASVLDREDFEKAPLQQAITEFLGFANTPMTRARQEYLQNFVRDLSCIRTNDGVKPTSNEENSEPQQNIVYFPRFEQYIFPNKQRPQKI